jgi:hypothetical protein
MINVRGGEAGSMMRTLKAGSLYFIVVFGSGFVLGPIRIFWLVPRVGERSAELLEAPIMLIIIVIAAHWITRRYELAPQLWNRLGVGLVALALILVAEFSLVLWLRGLTLSQYFATRDPVSGTVYYVMLFVFALMPMLLARK